MTQEAYGSFSKEELLVALVKKDKELLHLRNCLKHFVRAAKHALCNGDLVDDEHADKRQRPEEQEDSPVDGCKWILTRIHGTVIDVQSAQPKPVEVFRVHKVSPCDPDNIVYYFHPKDAPILIGLDAPESQIQTKVRNDLGVPEIQAHLVKDKAVIAALLGSVDLMTPKQVKPWGLGSVQTRLVDYAALLTLCKRLWGQGPKPQHSTTTPDVVPSVESTGEDLVNQPLKFDPQVLSWLCEPSATQVPANTWVQPYYYKA